MRALLALLLIVYLVGVGVVLAPVVEAGWTSGTAADFAANVARDLPFAFAWPARVYQRLVTRESVGATERTWPRFAAAQTT